MTESKPSASVNGHTIPSWLQPLEPRANDPVDDREVFELILKTEWVKKDATLESFEVWPASLRTMVQMILATDTPQCILWGKDLICIYNAAYWKHIAVSKHPKLMGMPALEAFPRLVVEGKGWNQYKYFQEAVRTQRPVDVPETLWMRQLEPDSDEVEEIYTSYKVSTIYGDNCAPAGLRCVHTETTQSVLSARRARMLRSLVTATQELSTLTALKVKLLAAFDECGRDFPICLLMLDKHFLAGNWSSAGEVGDEVEYRSFIGVGMLQQLLSRFVNFSQTSSADGNAEIPLFAELAQQTHRTRAPLTFETERFMDHCAKRAYNRPSKVGRMYPIYADDNAADLNIKPLGYLMLTFSPVRPVDDFATDYANTVEDLIKSAFRNFREVTRSQARLDEMNAIKKLGEQYFRVLNDSPVGISVQDWYTKEIIFSNIRWTEIMGYGDGHGVNDWSDLVYPDDLPQIYRILADLKPDGPPIEHMHRIKRLHTNGKPAWVTVNCSFYREQLANDQVVTFMTTAINDSSERVYAKEVELAAMLENQRLKAAREVEAQRADEADSAKARQLEYIDTLAHEIRNPISAIVQTVELLLARLGAIECEDQSLTDELQQSLEDLDTIDICTTHMSRVINDTLNISKLEHGSLEVKLEPCNLITQVYSVLRMLSQDMKNKNILCPSLIIEAGATDSFKQALTDPLRYKQIVLNLMTNAIKFTALQEGKKEIRVTLSVQESGEEKMMVCSVRDTGRGMSAEAVQKLFGKFYQASERTHIEYGGSGLGLFISQRLAVLLGGKISASSEVGQGSTFHFEIPAKDVNPGTINGDQTEACDSSLDLSTMLADMDTRGNRHSISIMKSDSRSRKSSPYPQRLRSQQRSQSHKPPEDVQEASPQQRTILVVEDNLINQKLMVKQLKLSGYRVLVGNHGLEALEHFKKGESIDLVVTDIEMPVMNGVQTLAAVRALDSTIVRTQPPFIACSAYAREEQKQAFIDAGMTEVLAKPHKFAELKSCVERVLMHRPPFRHEYTI